MARKENTIRARSSSRKKKAAPGQVSQQIAKAIEFVRSPEGRKVFALLLILISAFMAIAFVSHFFTGYKDQSVLAAGGETPANWLGSMGAWVSQIFVSRGFGLMGLLIPVYTGLWGFALLEKNYYSFLWKMLKYVMFGVIWGSIFMAFISEIIWGRPSLLGGGFGYYLNEGMFGFIGKAGMGLLILMSAMIFLVVNFNIDLPVSKLFRKEEVAGKEKKEGEEEQPENDEKEPKSKKEKPADEKGKAGGENAEEKADEKKEGDDFILSVRPAGEEEKENGDAEEGKPEEKVEVNPTPAELNVGDGVEFELNETDKPKKEKKADIADGGLELEINLPTPDQIPEIGSGRLESTSSNGGLELQVEDNREVESTTVTPVEGDNIQEVEENQFEKIIPENSQETLDPDEEVGDWEEFDPTLELRDYQYPTIDLLIHRDATGSREVNRAELEENKNKIVTTLQHYKIDIKSIKATIGPTVTLYEIVPAPGVRISKIRNLEDDIALSLAALGIRIIAPIPGKGTIGIEIPNSKPEIVSMRSVMGTEKFRDTKKELPLVLGRTISNEVYIADLAKMPHLLIAGATGQGKSVGINGIISSILYKKHPSQVKFVLIDPKKVELSLYSSLERHFLAKLEGYEDAIITDTKQVIHVLNSLCVEMDTRYDLLKKAKVRNLREYNEKFKARRLNPHKGHKFMPYIVLIIDEFADLMMTAGKEIETPIARLAQLARAIGIHLILATQRPSVNVITGIIKANFPARISFRVTSKVDSRTILDTGGADQLIGRGDMLLSTGSDVIRIQNAFIDTPEVDKLVDFIDQQRGYPQPHFLPEVPLEGAEDGPDESALDELDEKFEEAARLVVAHQQGSTSLIQRRLKLGYNRAGRIIDQLELAGIVGPFSGSKARDVLVQDEYGLEQILNTLR